jgi:hypothetical protein
MIKVLKIVLSIAFLKVIYVTQTLAVEFQGDSNGFDVGLADDTKRIANMVIAFAMFIWVFAIVRKVWDGGEIKKEVIQFFAGLFIWYVANQVF